LLGGTGMLAATGAGVALGCAAGVGVGRGVWPGRDVWPMAAIANIPANTDDAKIEEIIFMLSPDELCLKTQTYSCRIFVSFTRRFSEVSRGVVDSGKPFKVSSFLPHSQSPG
jgi:hypothetical protein